MHHFRFNLIRPHSHLISFHLFICFLPHRSSLHTLTSGHIVHSHCAESRVRQQWPGAHMSFAFLNCAMCAVRMSHPRLDAVMQPCQTWYRDIEVQYMRCNFRMRD
jgi:hypothetical protein